MLTATGTASEQVTNWLLRIGLLGPLLIWLGFRLRGAYSQSAWLPVKVSLVLAALAVAHVLYRAVLFFIVFAVV